MTYTDVCRREDLLDILQDVQPTATPLEKLFMKDPSITYQELHRWKTYGIVPARFSEWEYKKQLENILESKL